MSVTSSAEPALIDVPRGLKNVVAASTAIGDVQGRAGFYHYRQYSAIDLVEHCTLDEVWHLVLDGSLPDPDPLEGFRAELRAARETPLPPAVAEALPILATASGAGPLDALRTAVSLLAAAEGFAPVLDLDLPTIRTQGIRLVTAMPALAAALYRLGQGLDPVAPDPDLSWPADYLRMITGSEPSAEAVLREINGVGPDGSALSSYTELADDGSTSCGCWIYCGCYAGEINQVARRKSRHEQSWVAPEWGWAWPANRRIIYNRASADPSGRPWSERKAYVWWDPQQRRWTGHDTPDFQIEKAPDFQPEPGARAEHALAGTDAFIMQTDGLAWLYVPTGLLDGPLPAHYEPDESPFDNALYRQRANPVRVHYRHRDNASHPARSEVYPFVFTTYRLTEHHTAGGMSRTLPYLAELQPEFFIEVSPQLAAQRGLKHLGWATVVTARTAVEARVLITERVRPLTIDGRTVHQVGIPYHWGGNGLSIGDPANDLLPAVLDPNVHIQESKAATCDVIAGRRPRGPDLLKLVEDYRRRAGISEGGT